jgi:tRNA(fMet)-specific endonuclease VapC
MPSFMFDTDISSYVIRGTHPSIQKRMRDLPTDAICISAITQCEMLFGAENSQRPHVAEGVSQFMEYMPVLDFPADAAREYASLRAALKRQGTPIGNNDMLVAAHALHLGLTLVTNNVREFSRVPGLKIENWTEAF